MANSLNVIFMGTPDFATGILESLIDSKINVLAIFTQPDKIAGRKKELTPPHIKQYCIDNNISIPIYQPHRLREANNISIIKELNPDFIIVAAYAQILSSEILQIAPCINLHASILPSYRGASPIQQAILSDDICYGVTAMLMDEGLDTGNILGYEIIHSLKDIFVDDLFAKLSLISRSLILYVLYNFDEISPKPQINAIATLTKKIKREDGLVDFSNAKSIFIKHKAFKGWPDIFLESGLKLIDICINDEVCCNKTIGSIAKIDQDYIVVNCAVGSLKIYTLQPPSKQKMSSVQYIKGKRIGVGDLLL